MSLLALAPLPPADDTAPQAAADGSMAGPAATTEDASAEERGLVAQAQAGDLRAFERLYRRNLKRVYALCWRLADHDAAAEELVQEVFVRAWGNLGSFRGDSAFASWLYPMAVHLALDQRRARRRGLRFVDVDPALVEQTAAPSILPGMDAGFDLERALRALPPRARAVFVLHDVEGHQHDEIAVMMGVDPGTSKSQLHRARRLLRAALGEAGRCPR